MTVKDVVVSFTWWTSPDVSPYVAHRLSVLQVTNENLMIDSCTELSRLKEMYAVQVGNVATPENTKHATFKHYSNNPITNINLFY